MHSYQENLLNEYAPNQPFHLSIDAVFRTKRKESYWPGRTNIKKGLKAVKAQLKPE